MTTKTPSLEMAMAMMTSEEKMMWDYIEEESNDLLLKIKENIQFDGFKDLHGNTNAEVETLALKVVSLTMIKQLAILCETLAHPDIGIAYMQIVPMHADLIKTYVMKAAKV